MSEEKFCYELLQINFPQFSIDKLKEEAPYLAFCIKYGPDLRQFLL